MGSLIAQNFDAKLHRAAWSKFSLEGQNSIMRVHDRYYNVMPSSNAVETAVLHSGLPTVPKVPSDAAKTPLVDFDISPQVNFRHDEYREQYAYTRVAAADDQYGKITGVVGSMGQSAAYKIEQVAADVLNQGTTTTYQGWDALSLFNAAHKLLSSPDTYSNITTATGPSQASLQAIINYFKRIPNDVGQITPVPIQCLMCSPEIAPIWRQIVESNSPSNILGYTSGQGGGTVYAKTANDNAGVANVQGAGGITPAMIQENPYLTGVEDTYVFGQGHHLDMYMREVPNTDTYNQDDPRALVHRISMRFSVGFLDARRILRVPGS